MAQPIVPPSSSDPVQMSTSKDSPRCLIVEETPNFEKSRLLIEKSLPPPTPRSSLSSPKPSAEQVDSLKSPPSNKPNTEQVDFVKCSPPPSNEQNEYNPDDDDEHDELPLLEGDEPTPKQSKQLKGSFKKTQGKTLPKSTERPQRTSVPQIDLTQQSHFRSHVSTVHHGVSSPPPTEPVSVEKKRPVSRKISPGHNSLSPSSLPHANSGPTTTDSKTQTPPHPSPKTVITSDEPSSPFQIPTSSTATPTKPGPPNQSAAAVNPSEKTAKKKPKAINSTHPPPNRPINGNSKKISLGPELLSGTTEQGKKEGTKDIPIEAKLIVPLNANPNTLKIQTLLIGARIELIVDEKNGTLDCAILPARRKSGTPSKVHLPKQLTLSGDLTKPSSPISPNLHSEYSSPVAINFSHILPPTTGDLETSEELLDEIDHEEEEDEIYRQIVRQLKEEERTRWKVHLPLKNPSPITSNLSVADNILLVK